MGVRGHLDYKASPIPKKQNSKIYKFTILYCISLKIKQILRKLKGVAGVPGPSRVALELPPQATSSWKPCPLCFHPVSVSPPSGDSVELPSLSWEYGEGSNLRSVEYFCQKVREGHGLEFPRKHL